jgi:hypothetical protein
VVYYSSWFCFVLSSFVSIEPAGFRINFASRTLCVHHKGRPLTSALERSVEGLSPLGARWFDGRQDRNRVKLKCQTARQRRERNAPRRRWLRIVVAFIASPFIHRFVILGVHPIATKRCDRDRCWLNPHGWARCSSFVVVFHVVRNTVSSVTSQRPFPRAPCCSNHSRCFGGRDVLIRLVVVTKLGQATA